MRYIAFTLIVVNIVYFGWRFLGSGEEPEKHNKPVQYDVSQIELIDDDAAISQLPDESSVVPAPVAETVPEQVPAMETEAVPDLAPGVIVDGESLGVEPASLDDSTEEQKPSLCFETEWSADKQIAESLLTQFAHAQLHEREAVISKRYLVFIPPSGDVEKTGLRLQQLKAQGIDSALIKKGEHEGGISLGLFSQLESATHTLNKLKAAGVRDAVHTERVNTRPEYQVRISSSDSLSSPWLACAGTDVR